MKIFAKYFVVSLSLLPLIPTVSAFDNPHRPIVTSEVQFCYGVAMVGMDSVINSRLGVPAEHALEITKLPQVSDRGDAVYSMDLLAIMLNAYMWNGSPHSYAINTFYHCAQRQSPLRSAAVETQ